MYSRYYAFVGIKEVCDVIQNARLSGLAEYVFASRGYNSVLGCSFIRWFIHSFTRYSVLTSLLTTSARWEYSLFLSFQSYRLCELMPVPCSELWPRAQPGGRAVGPSGGRTVHPTCPVEPQRIICTLRKINFTLSFACNPLFRIRQTARLKLQYRYVPHNAVSVNDDSHIRRWPHEIIVL